MTGYIYCYTHKTNGKKYVGQTIHKLSDRAGRDGYRYDVRYKFGQAIRKYSLEAFDLEVLETLEAKDKHELRLLLNERERYYIALFDSYMNGYNSDPGGNSHEHSEETKQKISKSLKGKTLGHKDSEITKQRRSASLKGRKITEEAKEKARTTQKAKQLHWYTNGVENLFLANGTEVPDGFYLGKTISEEQKHRCRTQTIGYIHTEQTRAQMSASRSTRWAREKEELTMKTLKQLAAINTFVHEITATTSTKAKQQILSKYRDDETIRSFLYFLLNPYIVSGIGRKKVEKPLPEKSKEANSLLTDFLSLLSWIEVHNTGDYAAVKKVRQFADKYPEYKDLIFDTITKSLRIGCDSKTINSVMPNLIPQFSCMLAQKYFEKPEKLSGKTFAITTKLDGFRLIAIKDKFGNIKFYSRVGQLVEGLVEIEADLKDNFPNDVALDGELTISNYFDMPSKDAYKAASKIIRLKGDTPKTGLTYRVFDMMTAEEFISQRCPAIYDARRALLDSYAGRSQHIEVLPVLYRGNDTSKITEFLDKITSEGGEGCILNLCDAPYVWNRTWNLLKVKKMNTLDLQIIGFEEGTGRLAGTLGAILVRYKNGNVVKVGSGFTDWLRAEIWNNQGKYLDRICEIQWFEETTNADGGISLRFPIFKDFRDSWDKNTPDF